MKKEAMIAHISEPVARPEQLVAATSDLAHGRTVRVATASGVSWELNAIRDKMNTAILSITTYDKSGRASTWTSARTGDHNGLDVLIGPWREVLELVQHKVWEKFPPPVPRT